MILKQGDRVEKFGGDYTGPGVIRKVIDDIPNRLRYVVGHRIAGGTGEFFHIYSPQLLRITTFNFSPDAMLAKAEAIADRHCDGSNYVDLRRDIIELLEEVRRETLDTFHVAHGVED